jgi:hypothetical protein
LKRKKRLEKGIASLQQQISIHYEKQSQAKESGKEELSDYYEKEIAAKKRDLQKKKLLLEK